MTEFAAPIDIDTMFTVLQELPGALKGEKCSKDENSHCLLPSLSQCNDQKSMDCSTQTRTPIFYRSLVTDVFDGRLRSVIKCLTCHQLSETSETFQDWSLSIPTREQMDYIASHPVTLEDDDDVDDSASTSTQVTLLLVINNIPELVVFHF
ncbi:unnamed protein product [Gongylonema pulchrum]|uniref:USP domain-containing protein n=1 Tax=Gongylonema pulchrum TaxID=637853 RepID=A0A183D6Z2_9BILA|nr:unnamed protein product [Gongylonema pulchrum]